MPGTVSLAQFELEAMPHLNDLHRTAQRIGYLLFDAGQLQRPAQDVEHAFTAIRQGHLCHADAGIGARQAGGNSVADPLGIERVLEAVTGDQDMHGAGNSAGHPGRQGASMLRVVLRRQVRRQRRDPAQNKGRFRVVQHGAVGREQPQRPDMHIQRGGVEPAAPG